MTGALAVLALAAPAASAAVEYGTPCFGAETYKTKQLAVQVSTSLGAPILTSAPGVVTSWRVRLTNNVSARFEQLKVLREVGTEFEAIAESPAQLLLSSQTNEFQVRIPVPAGVRFGAYTAAEGGVALCRYLAGDKIAYFTTDIPVGTKSAPTNTNVELVPALEVVVEPDADGDGFGDETQDQCPQNASAQGQCPVTGIPPIGKGGGGPSESAPGPGSSSPPPAALALSLRSRLEGNVVAVRLTSSAEAPVTVTGSLKGRKVAGPLTVNVAPGQTGRLYLHLPRAVRRNLAALPRKRHLHLVLEATAAASGATATASTEQALPGRKPPRHHHPRSAVT
ncbi:MAG TPA: hypothetical protein VEB65_11820 [Solirubrobacterales bacterium]|nr:hypothetical protein [Solirubrobacterales bacterium]